MGVQSPNGMVSGFTVVHGTAASHAGLDYQRSATPENAAKLEASIGMAMLSR